MYSHFDYITLVPMLVTADKYCHILQKEGGIDLLRDIMRCVSKQNGHIMQYASDTLAKCQNFLGIDIPEVNIGHNIHEALHSMNS